MVHVSWSVSAGSGVAAARRHTKMNWTPDFHFLIVVTPLSQRCIQECVCHPRLIFCPSSFSFLRSVSREFCPSTTTLGHLKARHVEKEAAVGCLMAWWPRITVVGMRGRLQVVVIE
jgi:hypothetical protein